MSKNSVRHTVYLSRSPRHLKVALESVRLANLKAADLCLEMGEKAQTQEMAEESLPTKKVRQLLLVKSSMAKKAKSETKLLST